MCSISDQHGWSQCRAWNPDVLGAGYKSYPNSGNESADSTGTLGECEEAVVGKIGGM